MGFDDANAQLLSDVVVHTPKLSRCALATRLFAFGFAMAAVGGGIVGGVWYWTTPSLRSNEYTPMQYENVVVTHVLEQLNMTRSGFRNFDPSILPPGPTGLGWHATAQAAVWPEGTNSAAIEANQAPGYSSTCVSTSAEPCVVEPLESISMGWQNPGGGMTSTPDDMAKFLGFLLAPDVAGAPALLSAPGMRDYLGAGGFNLQDGLDGYSGFAWERRFANGAWENTKGGLTSGTATMMGVSTDPMVPFGAVAFVNLPDSTIGDVFSEVVASTVREPLRQAVQKVWAEECAPIPRYDELIGYFPGCQFKLSRDDDDDDSGKNCSLVASREEYHFSPLTFYNTNTTQHNPKFASALDSLIGPGWKILTTLQSRPRPPTTEASRHDPFNQVYAACLSSTEFNDEFKVQVIETAENEIVIAQLQYGLSVCGRIAAKSKPAAIPTATTSGASSSRLASLRRARVGSRASADADGVNCTGPLVEVVTDPVTNEPRCTATLSSYEQQYWYVPPVVGVPPADAPISMQGGPYCAKPLPPLPMTDANVLKISTDAAVTAAFDVATVALDAIITTQVASEWKSPAKERISVSVVAVLGGNTSLYRYHYGVTSSGAKSNSNTAYNIGSVTKVFTTLLLAMAHDSNLLRLSDTIGELVSGSSLDAKAEVASIPMAALASQTAGLPRAPFCGNWPSCSYEEEMGLLSGQPLNYQPHTKASYSNLGMTILGQTVAGRVAAEGSRLVKIDQA